MRISHLSLYIFLPVGLVLLGAMVWQVGVTDILTGFRAVGLWIVPWVLLESIPIVLHTAGWASCFQSRHCSMPFRQLVLLRLAGSAVNQITPTATIGGEVVKVLLLASVVPREQATAAVVIDKTSFAVAQTFYLALGMVYLTGRLPLSTELQLVLESAFGLLSLGLIGFVALQRYSLLSKLIRWLSCFNIGRDRLQRLYQHLIPFEAQIAAYYIAHPWRFGLSLCLHLTAFAFRIIQNFLLLHLLVGAGALGFGDIILATVAIEALDQMFFFVPGRLGTFESVRFTILSTLGIAHVYGLAFGLIARLESLFWDCSGLLAYAWCTRTWRSLRRVQPVSSASTPVPPTPC